MYLFILQLDWVATTLNPHYEENSPGVAVDDDRFILHSFDKWDFGLDNTGDIMNWRNVESLIEKNKNRNFKLVTTLLFCTFHNSNKNNLIL